MMTLPRFENPHPSDEELLAEGKRLHAQTDKMLATTGIQTILAEYGTDQSIEGSYEYGLMVWPDIDLKVLTADASKQHFAQLVGELASQEWLDKLSVADRVHFAWRRQPNRQQKGYWVGLDVAFEDENWSVDIWLQTREWAQGGDPNYADQLAGITDEQRVSILNLKYQAIRAGVYGKAVCSADIYEAVLARGALTYEAFMSTR